MLTQGIAMSNQAVFDAALTHIRKQRCQSLNGDAACMYRGDNDTSCAFAPCIEKYDKKMENSSALYFFCLVDEFDQPASLTGKPLRLKLLFDWARDATEELCEDVQDCHDRLLYVRGESMEFMASFELKMSGVAEKWDLNYEKEKIATVVPQV